MFDIDHWMAAFQKKLLDTFGEERVWFLGLQGSRARGDAREDGDIDIVVVLDELSPADVRQYRAMLEGMEHRDLICGFLGGKEELLGWESSDLFHFYHDTKPYIGSLDALEPLITDDAIRHAIKTGACNVYHGCIHNMVHERSRELLCELAKAASFVVRANYYLETHRFVGAVSELAECSLGTDQQVLRLLLDLRAGEKPDFDESSALLMEWAAGWVRVEKMER